MERTLPAEDKASLSKPNDKKLTAFILFVLYAVTLHAASISAKYDVSFSIFGKIGEANVYYEHDDRFYHIYVDAGLTGVAASMAHHRREVHESFGSIKEGILVPELYKRTKRSDHRYEELYFVFMPEGSILKFLFREKNVYTSHFDFVKMKNIKEMQIEKSHSVDLLPYQASNDLLSLFFNIRTILLTIPEGTKKAEYAAGARNDKGEILITNPAGKKRHELATLMPEHENRLITVIVDQDIFKSGKGELYLSLDKDHLAIEAMLKDVLLFGDIRGKRVSTTGTLE